MARKPTGRSPGRPKVPDWRDSFSYWTVEWVVVHTAGQAFVDASGGPPLAVGQSESDEDRVLDACVAASWLLSGGKRCADHMTDAYRKMLGWYWLLDVASMRSAMDSCRVPIEVTDADFDLSPTQIHDAYQRVRLSPSLRNMPALSDDLRGSGRLRPSGHLRRGRKG